MARAKVGLVKSDYKPGKPKKSRQGQGLNSKPRHNKKMYRGQGK